MSVKKLLVLSAAGVATMALSAAAFAGGPDTAAKNGIYVEGGVGYVYENFHDLNSTFYNSNQTGDFAAVVDAGYRWNQYLALEAGWFWLGTADVTNTNIEVDNWAVYGAVKLMAPIMHNLDAFFKAGVAYRDSSASANVGGTTIRDDATDVVPMFAGGVQYDIPQYNLFVAGQYAYIGRLRDNGGVVAPGAHVFTASLGYMFEV